MRYASVCSGVGTCKLAWEPLGWETAWFSETAEFPAQVLEQRFPDVPNHGDMLRVLDNALRRLSGAESDSYIDFDIELLAGGTPCQAFSQAGNRLSLEDARGNLTLAFVQLAHTIDALRPGGLPYVVWENVPGVLTVADNAFGCFLGGLAGEDGPLLPPRTCHPRRWRRDPKTGGAVFSWPDAGVVAGPVRTVAWRVLDAKYFGLPQRRRRVVVVSCPASSGLRAAEVLLERFSREGDTPKSVTPVEEATGPASGGPGGCGVPLAFGGNDRRGPIDVAAALTTNRGCHNPGDFEAGTLLVEPIPINEVGTRTGLQKYRGNPPGTGVGNSGDPAYTLMTQNRQGVAQPLAFPAFLSGTQVASTHDLSPALEARNPTAVVQPFAFDQKQITSVTNRSRVVPGDPAPTLNTEGKLSIGFTCKDSGQDAGEEISPTLRAMGHDKSHPNGGGQLAAAQGDGIRWLVRRLLPVEYEILQGYPQGHTDILADGKPAADGPRYRACGNGWARNVFEWVGWRIASCEHRER